MELDEGAVGEVCSVLSQLVDPDPRVQSEIFERFQRLQDGYPLLCFVLVHIVDDERFSMNLKSAAIVVLYRNLEKITTEYIAMFIDYAVPLLKKLVGNANPHLAKYSTAIMTFLFGKYGIESCPFFFELLSFLFQKEETHQDAVNCLYELAIVQRDVPEELLAQAVQILPGPHMFQILNVIRLVVPRHVEFICSQVMPLLLSLCNTMSAPCVGESGAIAVLVFGHHPEQLFGEFIAHCIMNDLSPVNSPAIAELLDSPLVEPFEPVILALMHRLSFQDDEFMSDGTCAMCQTILEEMAKWSSDVSQIVVANLDKCENPGHFCRCLYPVIQVLPNAGDFTPTLESFIAGPFKGDAAVCMMSACFSIPQYANKAIEFAVPLIMDEKEYVRQQGIFALTELFEFEFEPKVDILEGLIETFRTHMDAIPLAQLINRYVVHFCELEFTPLIQEFSTFVRRLFMEGSPDHPMLPAAIETVASLIQLANAQDLVAPVLARAHPLLMIDDPNLISSLCFLLASLVRSFGENVVIDDAIVERLSSLLTVEDNPQMVISVLEAVDEILKNMPSLAQHVLAPWTTIMVSIFTVSNMELSSMISQVLLNIIPQLPPPLLQELLHKCGLVMRMTSDLTESQLMIYRLGERITQYLQSQHVDVDPSIHTLFASHSEV